MLDTEDDLSLFPSLSPVSFPSEMLGGEGEDLLQQLSSELGLPQLMDGGDAGAGRGLCDQLHADNEALFGDLAQQGEGEAGTNNEYYSKRNSTPFSEK